MITLTQTQPDLQTDNYTTSQPYTYACKHADRQIHRRTDRPAASQPANYMHAYIQTYRQTDTRPARQTDRQRRGNGESAYLTLVNKLVPCPGLFEGRCRQFEIIRLRLSYKWNKWKRVP